MSCGEHTAEYNLTLYLNVLTKYCIVLLLTLESNTSTTLYSASSHELGCGSHSLYERV